MALKRKRSPLRDKFDIIVESEKVSANATKLAEKFGVGKMQVSAIIKDKSDLKTLFPKLKDW